MNADITVVRASHLQPFIDFLNSIGSPVDKLLDKVHLTIDDFSHPDNLIAEAPLWDFVAQASHTQGIEDIGFQVTERLSLDSFGVFGAKIMQAPTLYQALTLFINSMGKQSNCLPFWLTEDIDCLWFCRLGTQGITVGNWPIEQHVLSLMIQLVRDFTSPIWTPPKVHLQARNILGITNTASLNNTKVYTAKAITAVCIPKTLLLNSSLSQCCEGTDHGLNILDTVSLETAEILKDMLNQQRFDIPYKINNTAKKLGVSVRQMQRLLFKEKTNFRALTEEVLFEQAKKLLCVPELSILEISLELAYLDMANFSRAFKRWSGVSPSVYRRLC